MRVYLAAPLFSLSERTLNRRLATEIQSLWPEAQVILPQELKYHGAFNSPRFFGEVFAGCLSGLNECAAVVAILDGPDSDSGTAWECGYAFAKGLPVIGIRTDYRQSQEKGLNLMLSRSCTRIITRPSFDEDLKALAKDVVKQLKRALSGG